jgi:uncharacterized protein (TIGR03435 family)
MRRDSSDLKQRIEAIMRKDVGQVQGGGRRRVVTAAIVLAVAAPLAALRAAQTASQSPAFEVVSLKLAAPGITYPPQYGRNTWTTVNMGLGLLLSTAFDMSANSIIGLPDWYRSEAYTIDAKAEDGVLLSRESVRPLLRQLLVERFKLAAHIETTYAGGYALVLTKDGSKMKETPNPQTMTPVDFSTATVRARSVSMEGFARLLTTVMREPVADETALQGNFEFTFTYAPPGAVDSPEPSIFTALQDQLGLRLENRGRVPVQTLVIDHVEHPTGD